MVLVQIAGSSTRLRSASPAVHSHSCSAGLVGILDHQTTPRHSLSAPTSPNAVEAQSTHQALSNSDRFKGIVSFLLRNHPCFRHPLLQPWCWHQWVRQEKRQLRCCGEELYSYQHPSPPPLFQIPRKAEVSIQQGPSLNPLMPLYPSILNSKCFKCPLQFSVKQYSEHGVQRGVSI